MDEGRILKGDKVRVREGLYAGVTGVTGTIEVSPENGLWCNVYTPDGDWRSFRLHDLERCEDTHDRPL